MPALSVTFYNSGVNQPAIGFAPVPCIEGVFTLDKLPIKYGKVGIKRDGDSADVTSGYVDGNTVALDMP